jgi:hypothetical protein
MSLDSQGINVEAGPDPALAAQSWRRHIVAKVLQRNTRRVEILRKY